MNRPETVFVFRFGKLDGRVYARCISCDSHSPRSWGSHQTWKGFVLDTGDVLDFRHSLIDCSGEVKGPASIDEQASGLADLDANDRIAIICAQNYTILEIDGLPDSIKSPFFMSTVSPTKPARFTAEIEFYSPNVWSLPEPIDYVSEMNARATDRWDEMLVPKISQKQLKIPTGIWFPATACNDFETAAVYSVSKWLNEKLAVVELNCADGAVDARRGTMIFRHFKGKKFQIGSVKKVLDNENS